MKRLPETWDYSTALKWNPFTVTGDAAQMVDDFDELLSHQDHLFMNERLHNSSEERLLAWLTFYTSASYIDKRLVMNYRTYSK